MTEATIPSRTATGVTKRDGLPPSKSARFSLEKDLCKIDLAGLARNVPYTEIAVPITAGLSEEIIEALTQEIGTIFYEADELFKNGFRHYSPERQQKVLNQYHRQIRDGVRFIISGTEKRDVVINRLLIIQSQRARLEERAKPYLH